MSNFEMDSLIFNIPIKREDLLDVVDTQYYVKTVYSAGDICVMLRELSDLKKGEYLDRVSDLLNVYYSVIEHVSRLDWKVLQRAWAHLLKFGNHLHNLVDSFFDQAKQRPLPMPRDAQLLNCTKFFFYVLSELIRTVSQKFGETSSNNKKGRKADSVSNTSKDEWNQCKTEALMVLYKMVTKPLPQFWDPPIPEESFVNIMGDLCYNYLGTQQVKTKELRETAFQIIGHLIRRYNHGLTFNVKLVQVIKSSEFAVLPIAQGIVQLIEEFELASVVGSVVKEIVETLRVDDDNGPDNQTTKLCSSFLNELTVLIPRQMVHVFEYLDDFVHYESVTLRNCILSIMGEIVMKVLCFEDNTAEQKEQRDDFLEHLIDHMHDVSALVRAKVLTILTRMQTMMAIPLSMQTETMKRAVGRLNDKTINVRKNAVLLIKAFLVTNPYAAKLDMEKMAEKLEMESNELTKELSLLVLYKKDQIWLSKQNALLAKLKDTFKESQEPDIEEAESSLTDEEIGFKIQTLIDKDNFNEVITFVKILERKSAKIIQQRRGLSVEQQAIVYFQFIKGYFEKPTPYIPSSFEITNENYAALKEFSERIAAKEELISTIKNSIEFANIVSDALPKIKVLLLSKSANDINEAVDFFLTAYHFGIKDSVDGIMQMLYILTTSQQENKETVFKAFKAMFFEEDIADERNRALVVVGHLCKLVIKVETYDNGNAFEPFSIAIQHLFLDGVITSAMIQVMWERYTLKLVNTTTEDQLAALSLLITCAAVKPSIVFTNLSTIEQMLENDTQCVNILAGTLNLLAQLWLSKKPVSNSLHKLPDRYQSDNHLLQKIFNMTIKFFMDLTVEFDLLIKATLKVFYAGADTPVPLVDSLLNKLIEALSEYCTVNNIASEQTPEELFCRFIFTSGLVAQHQLIFIDVDVFQELKKRKEMQLNKLSKTNNKPRLNSTTCSTASNRSKRILNYTSGEYDAEDEEHRRYLAQNDSEYEYIVSLQDKELMCTTIMARVLPIVVNICSNISKYPSQKLQMNACYALTRFMTVDSNTCDNNMRLLMSMLNGSKNPAVRKNIVIALADLNIRFPNSIEPWTECLYRTLHDEDFDVRCTSLKMICHLILIQLLQTKGHLAEISLCTEDDNKQIQDMARVFFREMASKDNKLYNCLWDIISKLMNPEQRVPEDKFRSVMKFILSLINKDKQQQTLVEKLCSRFQLAKEEREWRDLAYCLTLISYNERCIRALTAGLQYYKDSLHIAEVLQAFQSIMSTAGKNAKPELKDAITELNERIESCFQVNDNAEDPKAVLERPVISKQPRNAKNAKDKDNYRKKSRRVQSSSESEVDSDPQPPNTRRGSRATSNKEKPVNRTQRSARNVPSVDESEAAEIDSSSDSDGDFQNQKKTKKVR